jgi:hypothetical protein
VARKPSPNDQRLTVFLPDGAATGRVLRFGQTGMTAYLDAAVPRDTRCRFTLHLQGAVIGGEVVCTGQEDREHRLQFTALTERDREKLLPLLDEE